MLLFPVKQYGQLTMFDTKDAYLDYVVDETGFDRQKIVVFNKENFNTFAVEIVEKELYTFYGIVYNDELISAAQLDIKSCWGQFLDLCKNLKYGDSNVQNKKVPDISYLKDITFNSQKKTVIFIYSLSMGKRHLKKYIKPILDKIKDDTAYDYIIIGLDTNNIRETL